MFWAWMYCMTHGPHDSRPYGIKLLLPPREGHWPPPRKNPGYATESEFCYSLADSPRNGVTTKSFVLEGRDSEYQRMVKPVARNLRRRKQRAESRPNPPKRARTGSERQAEYEARQREVRAIEITAVPPWRRNWQRALSQFQRVFEENDFGHKCDVCDRIWFVKDLKVVSSRMVPFLSNHFPGEDTRNFRLCNNCFKVCQSNKLPPMSKVNGYRYPEKPQGLPKLDPITERLISPRLPYMQIRRLRWAGSYGIVGQIINVPIDVDATVRCLPRSLDNDEAFNVNLKKNIVHKSSYISGFVKKGTVEAWLRYLIDQPLYKYYNITVDWSVFDNIESDRCVGNDPDGGVEILDVRSAPESELIDSRQQTMLFNEDCCIDIAPGQDKRPESLLFDEYAEELSFPGIYFGQRREIVEGVRSTPYTKCMSEVRRRDRRGVTPQKVLYMAMKILRLRVRDGIQNMFRCLRGTQHITRDMIEDRDYVERLIDTNQAFLKSIPNSAQYWASRKKDLFAMIRQLGRPTAFMTLSANETRWPLLLRTLYRLSDEFNEDGNDIELNEILERLDGYKRATLVAEDPVTCAIYFHKLVKVIMSMLTTKKSYNPFGDNRVIDYFVRIEWQNRGSPHAHILLWMNDAPDEVVNEHMPQTVRLINNLCSVDKEDLRDPVMIKNQTHSHTFTCTKRGEKRCRFNIPYWPSRETRILVPLNKEDNRRKLNQRRVEEVRSELETKTFDTIDAFLEDIGCDYESYLDLIRSSLKRATLLFKRDMSQIYINTFNPWIASILDSNMDLQITLDPYSCAAYVVDYVNKSERGMSRLHRELLKIHENNPEYDLTQLMTKVGIKVLNNVEMSAQEAAWYLLRQPMSWASRKTVTIPTMSPQERYKARKRKATMDAEDLPGSSTDIWTKSVIEKYEERPTAMEDVTLAQFAAWYAPKKKTRSNAEDSDSDMNEGEEANIDDETTTHSTDYRRREMSMVIRYRNYDREDGQNYMREMVTLHVAFRNELIDILDRNKYVDIYETNKRIILERRKEFEANIDMDDFLREIETQRNVSEENIEGDPADVEAAARLIPNDDDLMENTSPNTISAIRKRSNVLSKEAYCVWMRQTNEKQRELILEVIHRIHTTPRDPIQIFLTGPAGCGKTFTLKCLMETYNRYSIKHNSMNNAYIATATTGKAAVDLNGVTVHSAFRLTISRQTHKFTAQILQRYRQALQNVRCVIIDEISMCCSAHFNDINSRLQVMTGEFDTNFGGMDLFACGDLKQLPPVRAAATFTAPRNSIGGATLWHSLDYFPLTQVMRQNDVKFSSLLTKIGSGDPLTKEETDMIHSRFRTREWCRNNLSPRVMRLFHMNADVEQYNSVAIPVTETSAQSIAKDTYTGHRTDKEKRDAVGIVHRMGTKDTAGLPYCINLTDGYPYMLTVNVNVEDGLVNGAIGLFRYMETYPSINVPEGELQRIWLEFESEYIGRQARQKLRAHVHSKPTILRESWVPIDVRSVNIKVVRDTICRRRQFPLVPACAITIHKSQGSTFKEVVYQYHKNHKQQLTYVALSRVTSIEGLILTNETDDMTFHHANGSDSPTIRAVRNEYRRLETHHLPTLKNRIHQLFAADNSESELEQNSIIIVNMNVQSITAHAEDISTDALLTKADLWVTTETWITPNSSPVTLEGYELIGQSPCRKTGGVSIYKNVNAPILDVSPQIETLSSTEFVILDDTHEGDIAITELVGLNGDKFVLVAVYVHQHIPYEKLKDFLMRNMTDYATNGSGCGKAMPMILMGDFNTSVPTRSKLEKFLDENFGLRLENDVDVPTTLGNTCIDLTFSRYLNIKCQPYVSYFSNHRPVFNKIIFDTLGK